MRTRKWLSLAVLAGLLAGRASQPRTMEQVSVELDEILYGPVAELTEAIPLRCLPTTHYDEVDVRGDVFCGTGTRVLRRVLRDRHACSGRSAGMLRGTGMSRGTGKAWANELRHRCPGLRAHYTPLPELHAARVCSLGPVGVTNRFLFWALIGLDRNLLF